MQKQYLPQEMELKLFLRSNDFPKSSATRAIFPCISGPPVFQLLIFTHLCLALSRVICLRNLRYSSQTLGSHAAPPEFPSPLYNILCHSDLERTADYCQPLIVG